MNTITIFTGILSCLLLMLTVTHSFTLSGKTTDDGHHLIIEHPLVVLPNKYSSFIYPDDNSMMENYGEHELEKRRFNAWAGKRSLFTKRRFNAWAGRR